MSLETRAIVATATREAACAGRRIAREGGNAVDIAVAAALTATVSEILMCSLGGSGFIMIHLPGQPPELIDGYDAMPGLGRDWKKEVHQGRRVHLPYGDGIDVVVGHGSVAVPGSLAALELAWRRHGVLPWQVLMEPALEAARKGCPFGDASAQWLGTAGAEVFGHQPASRESFFPQGEPLLAGEKFSIPDLADTLDVLSREGARCFYQGDIARSIAAEFDAEGGLITEEDLASYQALVRKPLVMESRGFEVALNPPPAVGGAALGSLIGLVECGWEAEDSEARRLWKLVQAQGYLIGQREGELLSPDFGVDAARHLLEVGTLRRNLQSLQSPNTTHMSIATADGGLVSITMSMGYGAGITVPGTGISCNNSLGEPELNPRGFHAAEPGSRIVSNMAPMVCWHSDGRGVALGSPGASRITTAIAQTWMNLAAREMDPEAAVLAPRVHVEEVGEQWRVLCEAGLDRSLLPQHVSVREYEERHMYFGAVQLAMVDARSELHACADPRRGGATASWPDA